MSAPEDAGVVDPPEEDAGTEPESDSACMDLCSALLAGTPEGGCGGMKLIEWGYPLDSVCPDEPDGLGGCMDCMAKAGVTSFTCGEVMDACEAGPGTDPPGGPDPTDDEEQACFNQACGDILDACYMDPVSYTHLTLPTIYPV